MPSIFLGPFDLDDVPPQVSNQVPSPSSTNVLVSSSVSFDVTDPGSNVNTASIEVMIDSEPAVSGGIFQPGFSGTISAIPNGYTVVVTPDSLFGYNQPVNVDVYAEDLAGLANSVSVFWSFTTELDITGPVFSEIIPGDGYTDVDVNSSISFNVTDEETGVYPDSIQVIVDGITAYDGSLGGFQIGFSGSITPVADGYSLVITPDIAFVDWSTVAVSASASNLASPPVTESVSWSFQCADENAPSITPVAPTNGQIDVPGNTDIVFQLDDAGGIDLLTLLASVDGVPAYDGSLGGFQPGFTGSVVGTDNSYTVTLNPDVDFGEFFTAVVDVSVDDFAGNTTSESWSFTTADISAPIIDNKTPPDGNTDVAITTAISFSASDPHSGIDISTISMTVDGVSAIAGGVVQPGFVGSIVALPMPSNGYSVEVTPVAPFANLDTISISASASNNAGLATSSSWSFTTIRTATFYSLANAFPAVASLSNGLLIVQDSVTDATNAFPALQTVSGDFDVSVRGDETGYETMFPSLTDVDGGSIIFTLDADTSGATLPPFLDELTNVGSGIQDLRITATNLDARSNMPTFPNITGVTGSIEFTNSTLASAYGGRPWDGAFPLLITCGDITISISGLNSLASFAPAVSSAGVLSIGPMSERYSGYAGVTDMTGSFASLQTLTGGLAVEAIDVTNLDNFSSIQTCANIQILDNHLLTDIAALLSVDGGTVNSFIVEDNVVLPTVAQVDVVHSNYVAEGFTGTYSNVNNGP